MSWWPLPGAADEYTGDAAADAVDGALLGLAGERAEKPTLSEIVAALQVELGQPVRVEGVEPAGAAPDDVVAAVRTALGKLRTAYVDEFRRPPTTNEVLYTFTFCFGGMPESLVSGPRPRIITFVAG